MRTRTGARPSTPLVCDSVAIVQAHGDGDQTEARIWLADRVFENVQTDVVYDEAGEQAVLSGMFATGGTRAV